MSSRKASTSAEDVPSPKRSKLNEVECTSGGKSRTPILILNEDCLRLIFSYLTRDEVIKLAGIHENIQDILINDGLFVKNHLNVDRSFVSEHPPTWDLWVYRAFGRSVTALNISEFNEELLLLILPCFPNVKNLHIKNMRLTQKEIIPLFPPVESLAFRGANIDAKFMSKLFKRLDSSLRVLDFGMDQTKALEDLHNLRAVSFCNKTLLKNLKGFWKQNSKIERLSIGTNESFDRRLNSDKRLKKLFENNEERIEANYQAMADLPNLKFLFWRIFFLDEWCPFGHGKLKMKFLALEEVRVHTARCDSTRDFLKCLGPQLKSFTCSWQDYKCYDPIGLFRYPLLEHVQVDASCFDLDDLKGLKNVKTLKLFDTDSQSVFEHIKRIPALTTLTCNHVFKKPDDKYRQPLLQWLRQNNREVTINGTLWK